MQIQDLVQIGSRMQVARNFLGRARPDIAATLGVSAYTYGKFERGGSEAVLKHLDSIADALCVSQEFLLGGPLRQVEASELSFRRKISLKSPEARRVQAMASLAGEFTCLIERFVRLPSVSVPYVPIHSMNEIEDATRNIRNQLSISDAPLRDSLALAESLGVLVFWVDIDLSFDGVSFWLDGRPYIVLNRAHRDRYRVRFTVLHELGHLIAHRTEASAERHEEERKRHDREADLFASAFLLPATSFAKRFPRFGTIYDILEDRSYWMASCAAMVRRARQLHIIDEEQYKRLAVTISAKGWRRGEPNAPAPEVSRIHKFFLDEAGEVGKTTFDLATETPCPISWFREAFPQAEQYQSTFSFAGFDAG